MTSTTRFRATFRTTDITDREPFDGGTQAYSGATFERAVTEDGRRVVLKHLPAQGDWITRACDGRGRTRHLWESGLLARVADTVEHTVLGVFEEDGHDVVVMDDVSGVLFPPDTRIPLHEVDQILAGLATMHARFEGLEADGLCTPAVRSSLFLPRVRRDDEGPHPFPLRDVVLVGWELFAEQMPADIVEVVFAIHEDMGALEAQLRHAAPWTLLHGDPKLENLGLRAGRLVAVDWGELTGTGPAEMDVAWFAALSTATAPGAPTWRVDLWPDDVFARYEAVAARPLDPVVIDLAMLALTAQAGCFLVDIPGFRDEAGRARQAQLVERGLPAIRRALERWSPT